MNEGILRTPDERFRGLPDFPFEPHYTEFEGARMHYLDEGPRGGQIVLCLHGEPTWCFLYRKMIPPLVTAGYRVVAPDWIGFGRSDKWRDRSVYSYARHVRSLAHLVETLDLRAVTPVVQDWGGLIGLPWAAENPGAVARLVILNTALPAGEGAPFAFRVWRAFSQWAPVLPVGGIVRTALVRRPAREVIAGYNAPFPDERYKSGARAFPMLVPTHVDAAFVDRNRAAIVAFGKWEKPTLLRFGRRDPILRSFAPRFLEIVKALRGQEVGWVENAGHFVQEDAGPELALQIVTFLRANPVSSG